MSDDALNLHAGSILLGEAGVLIRGPSGSGKSILALRLVETRVARGGFAAIVADDRVLVSRRSGRLVARPHPAIAGLIEHRGLGIRTVAHEAAAVLRLVIDLAPSGGPRLPAKDERVTRLLGVELPRLAGSANEADALIEAALSWPR